MSWARRRVLLTAMVGRAWFGPAPMVWATDGHRVAFRLPFRFEVERTYGMPLKELWITDQDELADMCVPRWNAPGRTVAMLRWPHGALMLRRR